MSEVETPLVGKKSIEQFYAEKGVEGLELNIDRDNKETIAKIASNFTFKTDLAGFAPFKVCGHYPFHMPPILSFPDGEKEFRFVLDYQLLTDILIHFCEARRGYSMHASQIGVNYDFFVIKNQGEKGPKYETFINSSIVGLSETGIVEEERNESYPALYLSIDRPSYVDVVYKDDNNEESRERLDGFWARYFVQNYALSRGKPFWNFVSPLKREMAMKKRNKRLGKQYAVHRLI